MCPLFGELPGVLGRIIVDGELGEDCLRKGDVRGDPKDKGDGLYGALGVTMMVESLEPLRKEKKKN